MQCLKFAQTLDIAFSLHTDYQLPDEALPRAAFVLSVPFGKQVNRWKVSLDDRQMPYRAVLRTDLPYVDFVFDASLSDAIVDRLTEKYGDWSEVQMPRSVSVIPPKEYTEWAISRYRSSVGALAYSLLSEEMGQHLRSVGVEQIKVVGTQYNAFADEPFTSKRWLRPVQVAVGKLTRDPDDLDYHRYHNMPAIEVNGQILGTFATESPKLPVGTTFKANIHRDGPKRVVLYVEDASIQIPEFEQSTDEIVSPLFISTNSVSSHSSEPQAEQMINKLVQGVRAAYEADKGSFPDEVNSGKSWKIDIGEWNAYVRDNGDCLVRASVGEGKQTVCRFNLHTGEVAVPLNAERANELERMLEQSQELSVATNRSNLVHQKEGGQSVQLS